MINTQHEDSWVDSLEVHSGTGHLTQLKNLLWGSNLKYDSEEDKGFISSTLRVKVFGSKESIEELKRQIDDLEIIIDDWGQPRKLISAADR